MARTFVAIFPPREVREALVHAARNLRNSRNFRLVGQEKIHLTLKFLGDVAEQDLGTIAKALQPLGESHDPFEASTSTFGAFPSVQNARVLWAGIEQGSDHLRTIAETVEDLLFPAGFERESRPYIPHLTLGRARARRAKLDLPQTSPPTLRFTVYSVDLVKSTTDKNGVTYSRLASFRF